MNTTTAKARYWVPSPCCRESGHIFDIEAAMVHQVESVRWISSKQAIQVFVKGDKTPHYFHFVSKVGKVGYVKGRELSMVLMGIDNWWILEMYDGMWQVQKDKTVHDDTRYTLIANSMYD